MSVGMWASWHKWIVCGWHEVVGECQWVCEHACMCHEVVGVCQWACIHCEVVWECLWVCMCGSGVCEGVDKVRQAMTQAWM